MPYRVTQRGMLNGVWREGGAVISDEDAAALWNRDGLVFSGYLVATDDEPTRAVKAHAARAETPDEIEAAPMPSAPEPEPENEPDYIPPPSVVVEEESAPAAAAKVTESEPTVESAPSPTPKPTPRKTPRRHR